MPTFLDDLRETEIGDLAIAVDEEDIIEFQVIMIHTLLERVKEPRCDLEHIQLFGPIIDGGSRGLFSARGHQIPQFSPQVSLRLLHDVRDDGAVSLPMDIVSIITNDIIMTQLRHHLQLANDLSQIRFLPHLALLDCHLVLVVQSVGSPALVPTPRRRFRRRRCPVSAASDRRWAG